MGIFWDMLQQEELKKQQTQADSIEDRVTQLEEELKQTKALLHKTLIVLEKHLDKDIDENGLIGA